MKQAIGFFLNLLVLMILLKIFAPGLAEQLIEILGKVLALVNQSLDSVLQQTDSVELISMLWLA